MSELKFEALYYFLVLAERCHYGEAAEQLYITQQALSKSIKQLEEKLGAQLFRRQGRGQQLTPAGLLLQQKARELLGQVQKIENYFNAGLLSAPQQVLRIAAPLFPRLPGMLVIKQFLRANPHLRFECYNDLSPAQMEQGLLAGKLDCAFYHQPPQSPQLSCQAISRHRFVVVAAPALVHKAWNEVPYILYRPPLAEMATLYWPPELHGQPIVGEADQETGLYLCALGKGAMYLPDSKVQYRLSTKRLVTLAPPPFEQALMTYLIWRGEPCEDSLTSQFVGQILARSEVAE